ncbi:potassium transporter Kup [Archangium primigenium]|uniref:potassium transporter Kup n=1 Tax=[Archangium] primigenium TaxID=2792470 RepID=UPI00195D749C|nr:KUP/HAK/KT family potassium transporter [Archangium primigenium]MBM7112292.1 KUP/HAK/KT family potassium transporter [Archangium primigenium]
MTASPPEKKPPRLALLTLTAMGVVFGDLGTSPLYALQECFHGPHAVRVTPDNVLGMLSLFIWSLVVVVCLKYLTLLMRLDNQGEGGILALVAMLEPGPERRGPALLVGLGLFGAALLYGDGVITPAISVLSAVEGLQVATPVLEPYVVPVTVGILFALFLVQPLGTGRVGVVFGPIVALWFLSIGALGAWGISRAPEVLAALNPWHAVRFFLEHGWRGVPVLGAVILCLTGAEALYADMGNFGRRPIRLAWFSLALPALLLSYLSQGAFLLRHPQAADAPFFRSLPPGALYPMVALATLATVVASQALISAVFSLTHQAVQLGFSPRLSVRHTSSEHEGQIYLPTVNWALMVACIAVVLGFRSSERLAAAYGLAVSGTMAITTLLFAAVARRRWHWPPWALGLVVGGFLCLDLAFLGANLLKVGEGGWLPLALGAGAFVLMQVWRHGLRRLIAEGAARAIPLDTLVKSLALEPPPRVRGTAVFLSGVGHDTPLVLLHHLRHNQALHERALLLTVHTETVPTVPEAERLRWEAYGLGFVRVTARYGFMEHPDVPRLLARAQAQGLEPLAEPVTFYVGRVSLRFRAGHAWTLWARRLFGLMQRNAHPTTAHFRLPPGKVMELGSQVEL